MERGNSSGNAAGILVRPMTSVDALAYGEMVFAKLRGEMLQMEDGDALFGFVADLDGLPAGAVMARRSESCTEIESLFVKNQFRRRGVATALLRALDDELVKSACQHELRITYLAERPTTNALESALAHLGWNAPQGDMIFCHAQTQFEGWSLFEGTQGESPEFELFPWIELTDEDRRWIAETQRESAWIPPDLYPLQFENCEPVNSLGIRHKGRPVGWVLTHRIAPDTIRWTCSYMHPDHQREVRIFPAYREAARLQKAAGIHKLLWLVPFKHRGMARWVLRRWPKHLVQINESRRCTKMLASAPARQEETQYAVA